MNRISHFAQCNRAPQFGKVTVADTAHDEVKAFIETNQAALDDNTSGLDILVKSANNQISLHMGNKEPVFISQYQLLDKPKTDPEKIQIFMQQVSKLQQKPARKPKVILPLWDAIRAHVIDMLG